MLLLCLSKRIHSIFVLRLFNDCLAMLFLYISIYLFTKQSWKWGCLWFSLGVSIKMNILLFAPGLLLLLMQSQASVHGTLVCLGVCAFSQLALGAPFLLSFPLSYLRKAFELDRVFFYKWTVNFKVSHSNVATCDEPWGSTDDKKVLTKFITFNSLFLKMFSSASLLQSPC